MSETLTRAALDEIDERIAEKITGYVSPLRPCYSVNMGDAWEVFKYIGGSVALYTHTDGWVCSINGHARFADTAPLAVCRAALAAIGAES